VLRKGKGIGVKRVPKSMKTGSGGVEKTKENRGLEESCGLFRVWWTIRLTFC
jgi:hypothetical protein